MKATIQERLQEGVRRLLQAITLSTTREPTPPHEPLIVPQSSDQTKCEDLEFLFNGGSILHSDPSSDSMEIDRVRKNSER
jgi:hypothetical protein